MEWKVVIQGLSPLAMSASKVFAGAAILTTSLCINIQLLKNHSRLQDSPVRHKTIFLTTQAQSACCIITQVSTLMF